MAQGHLCDCQNINIGGGLGPHKAGWGYTRTKKQQMDSSSMGRMVTVLESRMSSSVEKAMIERSMMEDMLLTVQQILTEYCGQYRPGLRRVTQLLDSMHTVWGDLMIKNV